MREKIIWLMRGRDLTKEAKEILSLITEEIEKVGNPYPERIFDHAVIDEHQIFERCRQKILILLKE